MHELPAPDPAVETRRRPIRVRQTRWAHAAAAALARWGWRPNQISVLSVVCAAGGGGALIGAGQWAGSVGARVALLLFAGGCVQLRLLCNLLDGLIAVEGGQRTKTGEIYNELPDRLSDAILLAAAGYAAPWTGWERDLGWAAATGAVIVAYVRALGGQVGAVQQFCGPMAKQQRMFLLTLACVTTGAEIVLGWPLRSMTFALAAITLGAIFTAARRGTRIVRELEAK